MAVDVSHQESGMAFWRKQHPQARRSHIERLHHGFDSDERITSFDLIRGSLVNGHRTQITMLCWGDWH